MKSLSCSAEEDQVGSNWRVQIYRSIPVDAALFDDNKKHFLQSKVSPLVNHITFHLLLSYYCYCYCYYHLLIIRRYHSAALSTEQYSAVLSYTQ